MKIFTGKNVYDTALERIRFLFDEFPNVIANISGGKDSTVIFNLAMKVAREKNRLPLNVFFLDQEAEWQHVIDHIRSIMYREDVRPLWLQVPIKLFNATSHTDTWLYCWDEKAKDKWIHPKDKISLKENKYGTDRFAQIFTNFMDVEYPDSKCCYLAGVRTEESRSRYMALTQSVTYKYITYGKVLNNKKEHYSFYPIYDWQLSDVWKAIHDNNWPYCKIYDFMYQYGVPVTNMRISNVHHETAIKSLFFLQEFEYDTWNRIVNRLEGINSTVSMQMDVIRYPKELPFMFESWKEYRDYLLEKLVTDESIKKRFKDEFDRLDSVYRHKLINEKMMKECIVSLIINDYHFTKIGNFKNRPATANYRRWACGRKPIDDSDMIYVEDALNNPI